ncbi:MAG: TrmB family transcriptional regulator [Candidatus Kerfeldbacteria bacterium]|nr:TrmB family transcriptional regulator [Candidatus Kerfeldbacteria bacterium]
MQNHILSDLGLSEKEQKVYRSLLGLGAAPVRTIAAATKINRGTVFECLKTLKERGLVTYYHQETHQHFVAEPPEKLTDLVDDRLRNLKQLREDVLAAIPDLRALVGPTDRPPLVRSYEGAKGMRTILLDVLTTVEEQFEKEYLVYSSADIKAYLYDAFPAFSDERISKKIRVKVLSIGSGGELRGLDERKWLSRERHSPTYVILYGNRMALISVNAARQPVGVVIEDQGITQTQRIIFTSLWNALP